MKCYVMNSLTLVVTRAGPARQLPGAPTHTRRHDVTVIIGKMVLVNARFHMLQQFLQKLSAIWAQPTKNSSALS
jgi:hypothetical protein